MHNFYAIWIGGSHRLKINHTVPRVTSGNSSFHHHKEVISQRRWNITCNRPTNKKAFKNETDNYLKLSSIRINHMSKCLRIRNVIVIKTTSFPAQSLKHVVNIKWNANFPSCQQHCASSYHLFQLRRSRKFAEASVFQTNSTTERFWFPVESVIVSGSVPHLLLHEP
jgi:hypothetical protein